MGAALLAAPGYAREWKADATIAFFTLPSGPAAWRLRRTNKLPYVIALRGGDVPGFDPEMMAGYHAATGGLIRRLWRDADAVIANSQGLAGLARAHAPGQAVGVIPQGADIAGIAPKPSYDTAEAVQLLTVGRLARHKGLDILLAALALLPRSLRWELSVVGDGPELFALRTQATQLDLTERVHFRRWSRREDLPEVYRGADIFLLPSREEGMANVMMEAMCAALPVIATRIAGSSEAVVDGETGLLVPSAQPPALAQALASLINDAGARARMGRAGRTRAEHVYSWPVIADQWLDIVERIIRNKRQ